MRICCVMWLTWFGIVFCLRLSFGEDSHAPLFQTRCRDIANGVFRDLRRSWYVLVSDFFSTSRVYFFEETKCLLCRDWIMYSISRYVLFRQMNRVLFLLHIQWHCSNHLFKHCTLWFLDVLKGLQSTLSWPAQIWAWICAFRTCNRLYKRLYDKDPGKEAGISTFQGGLWGSNGWVLCSTCNYWWIHTVYDILNIYDIIMIFQFCNILVLIYFW